MKFPFLCRRRGFTLIELIAVLAILAVLAIAGAPYFADLRNASREAQMRGWAAEWSHKSQGAYFKSMFIPRADFVPQVARQFTRCSEIGTFVGGSVYSPGIALDVPAVDGWHGGFGLNMVGGTAMIRYAVGSPDDGTLLSTGEVRTCTLELMGLNGESVPEPRLRVSFPMWGCAGPFGGCNTISN